MLKHSKVGLIVWGAILLLGSLIAILSLSESGSLDGADAAILVIFLIAVLLGGAVMLVFGIVNAIKTSRYNNYILNQNILYYGFCPHCGTRLDCTIRDFRPHGRFPEGFTYCKVCKKPVSRNAFQQVAAGTQNNGY